MSESWPPEVEVELGEGRLAQRNAHHAISMAVGSAVPMCWSHLVKLKREREREILGLSNNTGVGLDACFSGT